MLAGGMLPAWRLDKCCRKTWETRGYARGWPQKSRQGGFLAKVLLRYDWQVARVSIIPHFSQYIGSHAFTHNNFTISFWHFFLDFLRLSESRTDGGQYPVHYLINSVQLVVRLSKIRRSLFFYFSTFGCSVESHRLITRWTSVFAEIWIQFFPTIFWTKKSTLKTGTDRERQLWILESKSVKKMRDKVSLLWFWCQTPFPRYWKIGLQPMLSAPCCEGGSTRLVSNRTKDNLFYFIFL